MAKYCCLAFVIVAVLAFVLWNRQRLMNRPRDDE